MTRVMRFIIPAVTAIVVFPTAAEAGSPGAAVQQVAATQTPANTPTQAQVNVDQLGPTVRAAIAAGEGLRLLETTTSPDVRAALLRFGGVTQKTVGPPVSTAVPPRIIGRIARRIKAHSSGCYGSPWQQMGWTEFGGTVAWIYVRENGWCGSYGKITWYGGPTFASWTWGPFCLGNRNSAYAWDYWPSWIHMGYWASLGTSYPWGCFTYNGGHVVIRIAWNGYWDNYDDFGF